MSGDHDKYCGTAEVVKREWVGLTDDEIRYAIREWNDTGQTVGEMIYAIEEKLREKNT